MTVAVKICGIQTAKDIDAACANGAAFVGFVFCRPSKRALAPTDAAPLALRAHGRARRVGLFVDPTDDAIAQTLDLVDLDLIQLHGHETAARTADLRARFHKPVIKVFHIETAEDLIHVPAYADVADYYLFDTKTGPAPTGGTGQCFDWAALAGQSFARPWFLAGGITPDNVRAAMAQTGAKYIDLSSGVETDGVKDPEKIRALMQATQSLEKEQEQTT